MGTNWFFSNVLGGVIRFGTASIIAAVCLLLGFSPPEYLAKLFGAPPSWLVSDLTRTTIVLVGVAVFIGVLFWDRYIRSTRSSKKPIEEPLDVPVGNGSKTKLLKNNVASHTENEQKPAIFDLYKNDFKAIRISREISGAWTHAADTPLIKIDTSVLIDFTSKSHFVSFYVPSTFETYSICTQLPAVVLAEIDRFKNDIGMVARDPADRGGTSLKDTTFTGRVFIYHESEMTTSENTGVEAAFEKNNMHVQMRGPNYRTVRSLQKSTSAVRAI